MATEKSREEMTAGQEDRMEDGQFQAMTQVLPYRMQPIGAEDVFSVEVRDVQRFLGSTDDPTSYAKDQNIRLKLIENKDFRIFREKPENSGRGRSRLEYWYSFDAAKEICMASNSAKGKEVRLYFLECERRFHGQSMIVRVPETFEGWMILFNKFVTGEIQVIKTDIGDIKHDMVLLSDEVSSHGFAIEALQRQQSREAAEIEKIKQELLRRSMNDERYIKQEYKDFLRTITQMRCFRCNVECIRKGPQDHLRYGHYDHIQRRESGGRSHLDNLQWLCRKDHVEKTTAEARSLFFNYWEWDFRSTEVKLAMQCFLGMKGREEQERLKAMEKAIMRSMMLPPSQN